MGQFSDNLLNRLTPKSSVFTPKVKEVTLPGGQVIQYFPQQIINLSRELTYHKPLVEEVRKKYMSGDGLSFLKEDDTLIPSIKALCSHFGIVLDGAYTEQDVLDLCEVLTGKLYELRTIHTSKANG